MIVALMFLALQAAGAAAEPTTPPTGDNTVSQVTVTARAKTRALPDWSREVEGKGWPFLGVSEDRSVLMFAKTAPGGAGAVQRVLVRHEFHDDQREKATDPPVDTKPYRSERLIQDVDCAHRTFRSLGVYRYPKRNLDGEAEAFGFSSKDWTAPTPGSFDETVVNAACTFPKDVVVLPAAGGS